MEIADVEVYPLWDKPAMANLPKSVDAIKAIDMQNLPPRTVLILDASTLRWQPGHPSGG